MITSQAALERVGIPCDKENIPSLSEERIAYLEGLVSQARTAAAVFTQYTQEDVDRILKPMVLAGLEQVQHLARLAIEETKLGVLEDKVLTNLVATATACHCIQRISAHQVHAFAEPARVYRTPKICRRFGLAGSGRSYD